MTQTEAPCILCSDRGVVDLGALFGCRTPGTYDPCPMCALRKQRDDVAEACKDARAEIAIMDVSSLPRYDQEHYLKAIRILSAAIAKVRGE